MSDKVQLSPFRPLVPIGTAKVILDCNEDGVLALIENGKLAWAWNIAAEGAKRREIRIWVHSLAEYLGAVPAPALREARDVIASLFPHSRPEITSPALQRMMGCSQFHVQSLIRTGALESVNRARPGPNGVARVRRRSVIAFLEKRRVI